MSENLSYRGEATCESKFKTGDRCPGGVCGDPAVGWCDLLGYQCKNCACHARLAEISVTDLEERPVVAALRTLNAQLVEALEFYGDVGNYLNGFPGKAVSTAISATKVWEHDLGKRARTALQAAKEVG